MASPAMTAANEEYEDIFCHFPTFLDDSSCSFSAWNLRLGILENDIIDPFPLMEPFVSGSEIVPSSSRIPVPDILCDVIGSASEVRNETTSVIEVKKERQLPSDLNKEYINGEMISVSESETAERKRKVVARNSALRSKTLCRDTISKYFHMPITQAAKELNLGLTLLKKKCRDLGIRRWPHRKLISLQTLIQNVQVRDLYNLSHFWSTVHDLIFWYQELWEYEGEEKVKQAICLLEKEMKLMVQTPDMEIEDRTKRLRQACFKANYKKRKLVMGNSRSANHQHDLEEEEDDLKASFSGYFDDR